MPKKLKSLMSLAVGSLLIGAATSPMIGGGVFFVGVAFLSAIYKEW